MITEGSNSYFVYGTMMDNTTRRNSLTSYPTIEGTSFSDHYYRENESVGFQLKSSDVTKPLVYLAEVDDSGARSDRSLNTGEVEELLKRWFRDATRLEISTLRYVFKNMVLEQYSWADQDLSLFAPTLTFKEAKVQTLRVGKIENPDQYYQATYGSVISVGGATAVESPVNIGSALMAGGAGAAVGAMVGSVIPGLGTAAGAIIGGCIGFFGNLLGIG